MTENLTIASPEPRVSVVMSVYNGKRFLPASIESILGQGFRDFEFLIVDDGSTDGSGNILRQHADRDPRIKLIQNDRNIGLTRSLNRALPLCRGGLIARHDSDDISRPQRLADQVAFLDANPSYGLLGSSFDTINETGEVMGHVSVVEADREIRQEILFKNPFCHGSVMFRRSLLEISLYDETITYAQDYALWSKYIHHTKAHNLQPPLVCYRVYENNISSKQKLEQDRSAEMTALKNISEVLDSSSEKIDLNTMRSIYFCKLDQDIVEIKKSQVYLYLDLLRPISGQHSSPWLVALREARRTWRKFMTFKSLFKRKKWTIFVQYLALCMRWSLR